MSKLVPLAYQPHQDYLVQVSICSIPSAITLNPFALTNSAEHTERIKNVLNNSVTSQFILFPEYTFVDDLTETFQNFSNDNNCVIIGGSGIEPSEGGLYAYCPVFMPNQEMFKVYKKHLTPRERTLSNGRIQRYPHDVIRQVQFSFDGIKAFTFSVFICLDFLQEERPRTDLVFVPQFEQSPQQFIFEADKMSKGHQCFVLGANVAEGEQRTIGCASLNSQMVSDLHQLDWRRERYVDADENVLPYHHTILYDFQGERQLKLRVNVGRPYSLPHTFDLANHEPVIIPLP